jgi:hypothetical protein
VEQPDTAPALARFDGDDRNLTVVRFEERAARSRGNPAGKVWILVYETDDGLQRARAFAFPLGLEAVDLGVDELDIVVDDDNVAPQIFREAGQRATAALRQFYLDTAATQRQALTELRAAQAALDYYSTESRELKAERQDLTAAVTTLQERGVIFFRDCMHLLPDLLLTICLTCSGHFNNARRRRWTVAGHGTNPAYYRQHWCRCWRRDIRGYF